jgi:hypothetical protein
MDGRELLELAAKAAGIEGAYFHSDNPIHQGIYQARGEYYWNPLHSDSEALRLAVKLRLRVDSYDDQIETMDGCAPYKIGSETFRNTFCRIEPLTSDASDDQRMAATRRAIVRAAAAIGKDMP